VHLHASEDRVYTTKESKRLMTLPEDYILTGTLNEKLARIGLMVAPMCMKYVADNIYETVLKPYKTSAWGSPTLGPNSNPAGLL
jgi:site-specific DNA-cytosine methylase